MDSLPRHRLGTYPPEIADHQAEPEAPCLGLSVRLDRPFHELKEYLLHEFERAYLMRCLSESEMNVSLASRSSGLSRKHLRTLMAKYGIRRGDRLGTQDDLLETSDDSSDEIANSNNEAA
jgi:DNA-binding NtrC family response regulator